MAKLSRLDLIERRMTRFLREPVSVRKAVSVIVGVTLLIVVAGGVAIRILDHHEYSSIWLGMWWSPQTVATIGYGDVTPESVPGRFVGALVMLQGIAFLAILTAGSPRRSWRVPKPSGLRTRTRAKTAPRIGSTPDWSICPSASTGSSTC